MLTCSCSVHSKLLDLARLSAVDIMYCIVLWSFKTGALLHVGLQPRRNDWPDVV